MAAPSSSFRLGLFRGLVDDHIDPCLRRVPKPGAVESVEQCLLPGIWTSRTASRRDPQLPCGSLGPTKKWHLPARRSMMPRARRIASVTAYTSRLRTTRLLHIPVAAYRTGAGAMEVESYIPDYPCHFSLPFFWLCSLLRRGMDTGQGKSVQIPASRCRHRLSLPSQILRGCCKNTRPMQRARIPFSAWIVHELLSFGAAFTSSPKRVGQKQLCLRSAPDF